MRHFGWPFQDAEILGAMSAAVFGEIDKATKRIGIGMLMDSIIDAEQGSILMLESKELILVVITQRMVNLGLVKMEMRRVTWPKGNGNDWMPRRVGIQSWLPGTIHSWPLCSSTSHSATQISAERCSRSSTSDRS